ncbi:MAG: NADH:ubiquinone reductase (Na(+)-transporting) subunit C [Lachnospiraceae bacterium]|nr:NADH:ubiquinone reductase (Na(+)-transporting) subunit C [Lachnospiraceae bacterium]
MNKQSNTYTIIYIIILVVVVGAALAFTAMSLKPLQTDNADADKMKQILASVHIVPEKSEIKSDFNKYITAQFLVNAAGERIEGNAFAVNTASESKMPVADRKMPVYECTIAPGDVKYIVPVYGAGLWGPIWGYLAFDNDGSTVYGAYFAHQGETPGLGAEIEKPAFADQFNGLHLIKDDKYLPIAVLKAGQAPLNGEDYVHAISGGTITSNGVSKMIENGLEGYKAFLESLNTQKH